MIELKTAKYKGVEFLFAELPTTGGNRLVKFNYPGSDRQSIERQGKVPRSHSMTIWISHDDYYRQRNNLLRVLEDGERGTLTHPTFGDVENVINGAYTLTESLSELGRGKIDVVFEVDDSPGIPVQSGNLPAQIQQQGIVLDAQMEADFSDGFEVTVTSAGSFADALETVNNALDLLSEAAASATESADSFTSAVNALRSGAGVLITATEALAEQMAELFTELGDLFDDYGAKLEAFLSLFDFGADDPVLQQNTASRIERTRNRDQMRALIRALALSNAYLYAALREYQTTEQLDAVMDILEDQYVDLRENQSLSNEALEQLDRLRTQAQKTFNEVIVATRSIVTVETRLKPLSVLVYEYYGNTDLFDVIAELNNIKQNAFVSGQIKVVTA